MEINEVKRLLHSQAESVAKMLLPAGIKSAGEWKVGSVGGEKGQSLNVRITGGKAGVWSDFASGEGGDLIDLWMAVNNQSLSSALDDIRDYLGVETPKVTKPTKESYTLPAKPQCTAPTGTVLEYLTQERCLPIESINAYKVAAMGDRVVFPFLKDETLHLVKTREIPDGKPKPTEANCRHILFGWQAIPEGARSVSICEGELDAISLHAYGYPSLSVPFGGGVGGKQDAWIAQDYHSLDRFEVVYLCMDQDEVGQSATQYIADRLGRHRCKIVTLPRKDANECLKDQITKEEIDEAYGAATQDDPEELVNAAQFYDDVNATFRPDGSASEGYTVPWEGMKGKLWFKPRELTLWTGISGSGKSQVLSHATVDFINQGARVCLASLEMSPAQTLRRAVKQAGGIDVPTEPFLKECLNWLGEGLWMYNFVGKATVDHLLEGFSYAHQRYGVDVFILDSFMRLSGIGVDNYKAQDDAIFQLTDWAVNRNLHLHVVAHARKASDPGQDLTLESIKGTSEIGANCHVAVAVNRHRDIDEKLEIAEYAGDQENIDLYSNIAPVTMSVLKNRNGDFETSQGYWFDKATYRYSKKTKDSRKYVAFDKNATQQQDI